jgi:acetyltransferase-like isoleucine patch superfamily enzyme
MVKALKNTYHILKNIIWYRFFKYIRFISIKYSFNKRIGSIARSIACIGTKPYHNRAFLARINDYGFISNNCSICDDLKLEPNVYIGDYSVINTTGNGGPIFIGECSCLYGHAFLETGSGGRIIIGRDTHIQLGCHIHAHINDVLIGDDVEIAPNCAFYSYNHAYLKGVRIRHQELVSKGSIIVGNGCWIGHGVIILQGLKIGEGAIIGAGSVVTRDIPANSIAFGVPAKVSSYR